MPGRTDYHHRMKIKRNANARCLSLNNERGYIYEFSIYRPLITISLEYLERRDNCTRAINTDPQLIDPYDFYLARGGAADGKCRKDQNAISIVYFSRPKQIHTASADAKQALVRELTRSLPESGYHPFHGLTRKKRRG